MDARTREHDWGETPLGVSTNWPQSLKSTVSLVLDAPLAMIVLWGPELVQIYNDGYATICGARHPKALGQRTRDCWPEVWKFNAPIYEAVQRGEARSFARQELTLTRSGAPETAWFDLTYSPLRDDMNAIAGVLVTVVESTGQVIAERRLAAEVQRQRQLFQRSPGFVCILAGPGHVFEFANDSYERLVGRTDLVGRTVREALPDLKEQGFFELLDGVYATGKRHVAVDVAVTVAPSPGTAPRTQYVDFTYEPVLDAAGLVIGIFTQGHDVTDGHLAREALLQSKAKLRDLNADLERQVVARSRELERTWFVSPDLHGVVNRDGFFENVNPAWTAILGWSREEVLRTCVFEFIHPDDVERSRAVFEKLRDGEPLLRFENRYLCKDGETRWLSWHVVPDGLKYHCSARDITEDKTRAAELLQVAEHLRQSQKMEAVGQLTGGIAHDFNNMLAGVIGGLDIIKRRMAAGRYDEVDRFVALARESGERAASLTRRLLAFSRQQSLVFETLDVNTLARGMEEMLRRTLSAGISLVLDLQDEAWLVKADASQLENALLNLTINARDAMPTGGTLTITTTAVTSDAPDRPKTLELAHGEFVCIAVSDTGAGMTEAVLNHAFDPFFTTKPIGQGTGLGLSMIYGFVKQSHGQVAIRSELGKGTTVSLWLPRTIGKLEAAEERDPALPAPRPETRMTVMVVEDEPVVRLLVTELLEELGYDFIEATTGDEALPLLRSTRRIHLLVTDVGLPGMNGRQLAEMARAMRPELKILFVTGYAETATVRGDFLADGMDMLEKPFAIDALGEKIRKMLGEA